MATTLRPDALQVLRFGAAGDAPLTAALVHFRRLGYPDNLYAHAVEACHEVAGWEVARREVLRWGAHRARALTLRREGVRRQVVYAYLDPRGGPARASQAAAWLATLGRGLRGASTGGSLLVLSTGDLPPTATGRGLEGPFRELLTAVLAEPAGVSCGR